MVDSLCNRSNRKARSFATASIIATTKEITVPNRKCLLKEVILSRGTFLTNKKG